VSQAALAEELAARTERLCAIPSEVGHEQAFDLANAVSEDLVAQFQRYAGADRAQLLEAATRFASVRVRALKEA